MSALLKWTSPHSSRTAVQKRSAVTAPKPAHHPKKLRFQTLKQTFPWLLGLIVGISLYDTVLIVVFKDTLRQMEQNPVGLWLINLGNGDVEIFVRAKLAGTLIVAAFLVYLHRYRSNTSTTVTTSLAIWQTGLFAYLTFS